MSMRMMLVLCALSSVAACEREPTPIEGLGDQVVLNSVINAGAAQAAVLLVRVVPDSNYRNQSVARPLPGAVVTLSDGTNSSTLPPNRTPGRCSYQVYGGQQDSALVGGCYAGPVTGGVRAGVTYSLDVQLPDGKRIHGTTTVPAPPNLRSPASGTTLQIAGPPDFNPPPMLVNWTTVVPAPLVHLVMSVPNLPCEVLMRLPQYADSNLRIDATGRDSLSIRLSALNCGDQNIENRTRFDAQLVLTVFDESYARYDQEFSRSSGVRSRYASLGITGAVGVFGSAATVRLPVVLVRQP
jgi:hypothetical protein